jgi:hypothetical protein
MARPKQKIHKIKGSRSFTPEMEARLDAAAQVTGLKKNQIIEQGTEIRLQQIENQTNENTIPAYRATYVNEGNDIEIRGPRGICATVWQNGDDRSAEKIAAIIEKTLNTSTVET